MSKAKKIGQKVVRLVKQSFKRTTPSFKVFQRKMKRRALREKRGSKQSN